MAEGEIGKTEGFVPEGSNEQSKENEMLDAINNYLGEGNEIFSIPILRELKARPIILVDLDGTVIQTMSQSMFVDIAGNYVNNPNKIDVSSAPIIGAKDFLNKLEKFGQIVFITASLGWERNKDRLITADLWTDLENRTRLLLTIESYSPQMSEQEKLSVL